MKTHLACARKKLKNKNSAAKLKNLFHCKKIQISNLISPACWWHELCAGKLIKSVSSSPSMKSANQVIHP